MLSEITLHDRGKGMDPREFMRCPECNGLMSKVSNTNAATCEGMRGIGRNRTCSQCGHRWRTIEVAAHELDKQDSELKQALIRMRDKVLAARKALS